jgi:GntR family transcriptional repressor for pyruvate dehydrogenase complex
MVSHLIDDDPNIRSTTEGIQNVTDRHPNARAEDTASSGAITKAAALASQIRRIILVQGLRAGDPLPSEAELIAEHGISRPTVREAIRILDAEGFVEVRIGRNGGLRVAEPKPEALGEWLATQLAMRAATVHSLVEFRVVVEPVAAGLAAHRASSAQIQQLREAAHSPSAEEELDFHLYVADATQNELLRVLLRAVHTGLREHRIYQTPSTESDAAAGRRAHIRLFDAIADRDAELASTLMRKHMQAVEQVLRRSGGLHEPLVTAASWGLDQA